MKKLFLHSLIFILGIAVAFAFAVRGKLPLLAHSGSPLRAVSIEKLSMPSSLDGGGKQFVYEKKRRDLFRQSMSSQKRLVILEAALRDLSPDSLQLLRKEHLAVLPDYKSKILPALKIDALKILFEKFSDIDWRSWPLGALNLDKRITPARSLVDTLATVNPDLAAFLETAAYLLHGMYESISAGTPYPIEDDLRYLVVNASKAVPASDKIEVENAFDSLLLRDQRVRISFEKVKAALTMQFLNENPESVREQLLLLLDIAPMAYSAELEAALIGRLNQLALHASPEYRTDGLKTLTSSAELEKIASRSEEVSRALSNLYVVSVVDALDAGNPKLAKQLLALSEQTYPSLKGQDILRQYLDQGKSEQVDLLSDLDTAEEVTEESSLTVEADDVLTKETSGSGVGLLGWILGFFILAVFGLITKALYGRITAPTPSSAPGLPARRSSQSADDSSPRKELTAPDTDQAKITDPSEISFSADDEDTELDFDFDFSKEVNRS